MGQKETIRGSVSDSRPLVVDVDGTLIRSDLLLESIFALVKRNLFFVFLMPFWLVRGKAHFKHEIANRVDIDAALLPYQEQFLDFLKAEREAGRKSQDRSNKCGKSAAHQPTASAATRSAAPSEARPVASQPESSTSAAGAPSVFAPTSSR